ncbi:LOW QUALITY PROTEIN: mas-related G-protein coupled receptor member E [Trichechus inunguis]
MAPRRPSEQSASPPRTQEDAAFNIIILCLTEALGLGGLLRSGAVWACSVYWNPSAIYHLGVASADLVFLGCHMVAIVPTLQGHLAIPSFMQAILGSLQWSCYLWHLHAAVPEAHLCLARWLATAKLFGVLCVAASGCSLVLLLRRERGDQRPQPCQFPALVLLSVLLSLFCGLPLGVYCLSQNLRWHIPHFYHLSLLAAAVDRAAKPVIYFSLPYKALPSSSQLQAHRSRKPRGIPLRFPMSPLQRLKPP